MAASCALPQLVTSTNVSNQPMRRLLRRVGWNPVGLLHGPDAGDPELFSLRPAPRGFGPEGPVPRACSEPVLPRRLG
ncbi:hypothetical protein ACWEIM_31815 [Streptomyces sp. NPDC004778]